MDNLYELLNVSKDANSKEIKTAYYKMIRKYPPEKHPEEFKKIRDAYEVLIDVDSRAEYDAFNEYGKIIEQHEQKAREAMDKKEYKVAIREYKKILIIEPSLSVIKNRLALALLYDGDIDSSEKHFLELVEKHPRNVLYIGNLAFLYSIKEDFIKSEKYYLKACELDPVNDQLILDLVNLYVHFKKYKKAIILLEKSISKPKSDDFQNFLYYFKMIRVHIYENNIEKIDQIINKIESLAVDDDTKEYVSWECGKIAYELFEAEIYGLADKIALRAKNIYCNESIENLCSDCRAYLLYFELCKDERIKTPPLSGPIYYYLFGHKYDDKSKLKEDRQKNLNAIDSYLTYGYSNNIIKDINILKEHYKQLYEYMKDLYDNIYNIASDYKKINDQYTKMKSDSIIPSGIKKLIALWMFGDDMQEYEKENGYKQALNEISNESKNTLINAIYRVKSDYNSLYNLNSTYFNNLQEALNKDIETSRPQTNYNSSSSDSGCLAVIICTIIGTVLAPGIGTVLGFFIGCNMLED